MPESSSRPRWRTYSRRAAVAGTAAGLVGAAVATVPAAAAGSSGTAALTNSRPGWAKKSPDLGRVSGSRKVDFAVVLKLRDAAGAASTIKALTTPGSSSYRHWLTDAEFRARYSPTSADVAAVSSWLRKGGLHVASVAASRLYVEVTGTSAAAEKLFDTTLHTYSYKKKDLVANTSDLRIPTRLSGVVAGVNGLDDSSALKHPASGGSSKLPGPPPGTRYGVQPCSAYYGQKTATKLPAYKGKKRPFVTCGYDSGTYADAYGLTGLAKKGYDGSGVTVAITDAYAAPTMLKDLKTYSRLHNIAYPKAGQYTEKLPAKYGYQKLCGPQGWYGEESLDVDAVHGMAPGANILYVGGSNCATGLDIAWAKVIDHHLADIVTNSWSEGTENVGAGLTAFYDEFAQEAALTGVSTLFSSGDDGDEVQSTGTRQVGLPASDPYVTAVGGTSVGISKSHSLEWTHGWENAYSTLENGHWTAPAYSSGSGGGTSQVFKQPYYQKGVVPASISKYFGGQAARAVPDISMPGDPNTGMTVGETQAFPSGTYYAEYRIGGTSLSSPLLAGALAVANQYAGQSLGFINPVVYRAAKAGNAGVSDVLPPKGNLTEVRTDYANFLNASQGYLFRLRTVDYPTSIFTRQGYDDVTGVGAPTPTSFVTQLTK